MQTAMQTRLAGRRVALPLPRRSCPRVARCSALHKREEDGAAPSPAPQFSSAPLMAMAASLAAAAPCMAEDIVSLGPSDKPLFALTPAELALVTTPLIGYAIYNYARTKNQELGFNDLLLIIAAVFLFGNIFSILVFKTSFY